ncbi:hypothetical protein L1987_50671 [Smallanthus sonchifolius]|uniref:Uncharacterized protein n=1 Tax=Smallanthus sonchifolius TaxID=185202 RepID=A0ACB9ENZ0_9ASTR|nr:hypothetical protein L1987_50671 [Smallanthus sonchifolius]
MGCDSALLWLSLEVKQWRPARLLRMLGLLRVRSRSNRAMKDLGRISPSIVASQYASLPASESIKYGPSHFGASFPSLGLVVLWNAFLSTKSPTWNLLILILLLYDLAILCW